MTSLFLERVWKVNIYVGVCIIVFLILYQYFKRHEIAGIIDLIHGYDEKVSTRLRIKSAFLGETLMWAEKNGAHEKISKLSLKTPKNN